MQPKNIYKSLPYKDWCTNKSIRVLSLYQSPKNKITLAFADKIDIKSSITETDYTNAIVVCKQTIIWKSQIQLHIQQTFDA